MLVVAVLVTVDTTEGLSVVVVDSVDVVGGVVVELLVACCG